MARLPDHQVARGRRLPRAVIRRLVLLRHGQTAYNRTQRIQGQFDADLDDTGRAQAIAVAPHVAALAPVVLWSSDLSRARDTAAAVAAATGLAPTYDARLREFGFGDLEGITHAEYAGRDPGEYARFRQGDYDA
ncbi:MAG: histidine phosphatase family protein, partial [Actinobacteria bacterium]|nr:histidine phosphatase family protein [Actinomycetota bacterium]